MLRLSAGLGFALLLATAPAHALSTTYVLAMDGAQEVPGPGDPDGTASGTITLDDATDQISWSFTYSAIAAPTAMHIHGPAGSAGSQAGIFVSLGVAAPNGPGTLDGSTTAAAGQVSQIFANPTDFYVNIHTGDFPGGAVRGQLGTLIPEPAPAQLIGLGAIALAWMRRQRRRKH